MLPRMERRRPIITLTTDFGLRDHYVAAMKAAILVQIPDTQLIDITHHIPPQDVLAGSFALERAVAEFPVGTVHLAVVDPGVGTTRPLIVVEVENQLVVCPDNGLITWTWRRHSCDAYELIWRPGRASSTFHGRDIMAPAAAMLATGHDFDAIAGESTEPNLLNIALADAATGRGQVIYIDHFGNCTTNIPAGEPIAGRVSAKGRVIGPIRQTYADADSGAPLALIGSSGLVEIAARNASAAQTLGLAVGDEVLIGP
jgi:S-adenosyl-L-methionine hydrolase (adenosine-forming)